MTVSAELGAAGGARDRAPLGDRIKAPRRNGARAAGNFVTYTRTQFESLAERPLGAVDSLVLSWLAYFHLPDDLPAARTWEGAPVRDLLRAECFDAMFGTTWDPEGSRDLLAAVCASPRFRTMRVCGYRATFDEAAEEQFAAMTFRLGDGSSYIAFRGTDSTLVGWKEDFNMAFQSPVPSQEEAARYLEEAARTLPGPLLVGGHSKGGNLAVYASIMCPHVLQDRIVRAFSHDGPGFNENFLRGKGYARMRDRIDKTLPESSVFGMIFEDQEDYSIVASTGTALWQHNPFSWVVEGTVFKTVERISTGARYVDATLASWLAGVSPEERGRFIDALYGVIDAADAERFADIREDWQEAVPKMVDAARELDPETRSLIARTLRVLAKSATWQHARAAAGQVAEAAAAMASRAAESLLPSAPLLPGPSQDDRPMRRPGGRDEGRGDA